MYLGYCWRKAQAKFVELTVFGIARFFETISDEVKLSLTVTLLAYWLATDKSLNP